MRKSRRNRKGGANSDEFNEDQRKRSIMLHELTKHLEENDTGDIFTELIKAYILDMWSPKRSTWTTFQWKEFITNELINNEDELRWNLDEMGREDINHITLRHAWIPYPQQGGKKRKTRRNRKGGYSDGPIKHFEPFKNLEQAQEVLTRHLTVSDNRHVTRFLVNYLKYYIRKVWNHHPRWTRRKWEDDIRDEIMGYNGEDNFIVDVSTYDADNIYDYDQLFGAWIPFPRHRVPYGQGGKKRKSRKSKKGKKRLTKRHRKT
jgi:hypothetical protein